MIGGRKVIEAIAYMMAGAGIGVIFMCIFSINREISTSQTSQKTRRRNKNIKIKKPK